MKKITFALLACILLSGCMNLYVRCPGTSSKICTTYQSTQGACALSYVVMFPQVIGSMSNSLHLCPENIITVPLGCLCFVDVPCEAVLDTVFFPVDWMIVDSREKFGAAKPLSFIEEKQQ